MSNPFYSQNDIFNFFLLKRKKEKRKKSKWQSERK